MVLCAESSAFAKAAGEHGRRRVQSFRARAFCCLRRVTRQNLCGEKYCCVGVDRLEKLKIVAHARH